MYHGVGPDHHLRPTGSLFLKMTYSGHFGVCSIRGGPSGAVVDHDASVGLTLMTFLLAAAGTNKSATQRVKVNLKV